MSLTSWQAALLVSFSFLLATGQILFKYAAITSPKLRTFGTLITLLQAPTIWAAGIVYTAATLLWVSLLQEVPLSRAYPFVALGFVLIPIAGIVLFGEAVSTSYFLGVVLIIVGIYLTGLGLN